MTPAPPLPQRGRHNRMMLLAILAPFIGALLFAGTLRFSGWRPAATRNFGELLQPPGDLRQLTPRLAGSGGDYPWDPRARIWRIALAPPPDCVEACIALARQLDTVWRLFGPRADQVQVLWIGTPPDGIVRNRALRVLQPDAALRAGLPRNQAVGLEDRRGVPVYVIDPNGFVILRYPPGFDPAGLRADMAKLLKLM